VMIARSGITNYLIKLARPLIQGKRAVVLFVLAIIASFSQNIVPVHIAFIPILIPPLLSIFNKIIVDRRGIATALTFGLKAHYMLDPMCVGLIYQGIIYDEMIESGMELALSKIPVAIVLPVI